MALKKYPARSAHVVEESVADRCGPVRSFPGIIVLLLYIHGYLVAKSKILSLLYTTVNMV